MPSSYEEIDLWFTDEGDFKIDGDGDIADTSATEFRSIIQEITTRVKSTPGDWRTDPELGAGLERFVGEPNTRDLANNIMGQIADSLVNDRLIYGTDLLIIPAPIDIHTLIFRLILAVGAAAQESVSLTVVYDTSHSNLSVT